MQMGSVGVRLICLVGAGFHKVVRMRVVAPTPVTERSMGREVSSIPAHYPPGSAASSAANARRAGEAAQQSPPAELPQEPRSMQPVPVRGHTGGPPACMLHSSAQRVRRSLQVALRGHLVTKDKRIAG